VKDVLVERGSVVWGDKAGGVGTEGGGSKPARV